MNIMHTVFKFSLLISVATSLVFTSYVHSMDGMEHEPSIEISVKDTTVHAKESSRLGHSKEYIVVLEDKPLISKMKMSSAPNQSQMSNLAQSDFAVYANTAAFQKDKRALATKRQQAQLTMAKQLNNVEFGREFDVLLNGYVVRTTQKMETLLGFPGVKAVYPNLTVKSTLENALPIIKAQQSWQVVGGQSQAGQGQKIAIIDSGITPDHPMFDDTGMTAPASLPGDDYCASTSGFCNNKIIVARHYTPDDYTSNPSKYEGEFNTPQAFSGHGTHVAAIAGGREVVADSGETLIGVAPAAYLMVYKALWGEQGVGTTVMLISALEDAFADGADVINNSYGLPNTDNNNGSIFDSVFKELEANGVVLVSSAGNEGDQGAETISCPACVQSGIAVASTTTDLIAGYILEFGSNNVLSQPGNNYVVGSSFSGVGELAQDTDNLGCDSSAWSGINLASRIAVVKRGTCTFRIKAQTAAAAGASAMVVINNVPGPNVLMEIGEDIELTSTFISQNDGELLLSYLSTSLVDTIAMQGTQTRSTNPAAADVVSGFSSIGPNDNDAYVKPDMAAPGDLILSAVAKEDPLTPDLDYGYLGGTSMSSPMVAGAAALLKQHEPSLTAVDIKNILINSVDGDIKGPDGSNKATAFEAGSGRLNILSAMNLTAYATTPNLTNNNCQVSCRMSSSLRSVTATSESWSGQLSFHDTALTGTVSPSQISLTGSGDTESFEVSVNLPFDQDVGWYFGELVWTNGDGKTIRQGIAVANIATNSDKFTLTKVSSTDTQADYRLTTDNFTSSASLGFDFELVGGAEFDPQSLAIAPSSNVSNQTVTNQRIVFDLALQAAQFETFGDVPFAIDVNNFGFSEIQCGGDCDEFSAAVNFSYTHFGVTYDQITVASNGVAFVGDNITSNDSFTINQGLPYDGTPDGIIAPFWTDFDLKNSADSEDLGGGSLKLYQHNVSGKSYLVVQWDKVKLYSQGNFNANYWGVSDIDAEYTFQLIIEQNSENKWFRYISIPEQPNFYTIGAESGDSSVGISSWYNGVGSNTGTSGSSLRYQYTAPEEAVVEFSVNKAADSQTETFAVNDTASVQEDSSAAIDVLANDLTGERVLLIASVEEERVLDQLFTDQSDFTLVASSVQIEVQPTNGTATVNTNGTITYQPTNNFNGSDSLTYSVQNSNGVRSSAELDITVTAVNDEPTVVDLDVPASAQVGQTITLSVEATDIDSLLTYRWNLPAGFSASVTDERSIQVSITSTAAANSNVSVVVSDGEFSLTASATISVTNPTTTPPPTNSGGDSGGGSVPKELLVGVLMIMLVRRIRAYRTKRKSI